MAVLLSVVLLTLALVAMSAVRRVPAGQAWTVHRLGRYARTLQPGAHLVWPVLDSIARQVSLIGHHVELPTRLFGADNTSADLYYQILDPMRSGDALESVDEMVLRHAGDALTSVVAQLPAHGDSIHATGPAQAATMADALKTELNRRVDRLGLRVIRCALHAS